MRKLQVMETVRAEESALSSHISTVPQLFVIQVRLFKCYFTFSIFTGHTSLNYALLFDLSLPQNLTLRFSVFSFLFPS